MIAIGFIVPPPQQPEFLKFLTRNEIQWHQSYYKIVDNYYELYIRDEELLTFIKLKYSDYIHHWRHVNEAL